MKVFLVFWFLGIAFAWGVGFPMLMLLMKVPAHGVPLYTYCAGAFMLVLAAFISLFWGNL